VFAAGDFNTTSGEDSAQGMLERFVNPFWTVVHQLGCDECKGTHYYARDDVWSFLDMILWSPPRNGEAVWKVDPGSVRIANRYPAQVTGDGTPARFRMAEQTGVSDQWPMIMTLKKSQ
jgi:hypothetical protein